MPRRIQSDFSNGMITDTNTDEKSLFGIRDMYVRRPNELCTRNPIASEVQSPVGPTGDYSCGFSNAAFHPNFGTAVIRGTSTLGTGFAYEADNYQLVAAGLQENVSVYDPGHASGKLDFKVITENGPGAKLDRVCTSMNDVAGNPVLSWYPMEFCEQSVNTDDEIIFAGKEGRLFKYGGSQLAPYSAGTVSVSSNSTSPSSIITGAGTSWSTTIEAGQYILIDTITENAAGQQRAFRITHVHSNTQLEIETPVFKVSANAGLRYRVQSVACIQSPAGTWNRQDEFPRQRGIVTYWQQKLWTAGVADRDTDFNSVFDYDKIRYSGTVAESNAFSTHLDLWHPNGYLYAEPGHGGAIMGLVPMGNALIVIKASAIFRISGQSDYDGTGAANGRYRVDAVSQTVGATSRKSFCMTKMGLVIASHDGLYLLNEDEGLISLTDGRIARWWESTWRYRQFNVQATEDKVLVTTYTDSVSTGLQQQILVWVMDGDYFFEMTDPGCISYNIVTTYTASDYWSQEYGFPIKGGPVTAANNMSYIRLTNIMHKKTFEVADTDAYTADANPEFITHPYPIGQDEVSEGRVNNLVVHSVNLDGTAENIVSLLPGSTAPSFGYDGVQTNESTADELSLEYTLPQGSTDRANRIPVEGMEASPTCRVRFDASIGSEPNICRVYSVGIDYEQTNVQE